MGINVIINCSPEVPNYFPEEFLYENVGKTKLGDVSLKDLLQEIPSIIRKHLLNGRNVLIHCSETRMVSACSIISYFLLYHSLSLYDATDRLFSRDSSLKVDVSFLPILKQIESETSQSPREEILDSTTYQKESLKTQMYCNLFPKQVNVEAFPTTVIHNFIDSFEGVYSTWYQLENSTPAEIFHNSCSLFDIIDGFCEDIYQYF